MRELVKGREGGRKKREGKRERGRQGEKGGRGKIMNEMGEGKVWNWLYRKAVQKYYSRAITILGHKNTGSIIVGQRK